MLRDFYKGRRVFVTGHTGFKGSWLTRLLLNLGAEVIGYSLPAPTQPNLFSLSKAEKEIVSIHGDIRDYQSVKKAISEYRPELVFHLAAQPLVRESYLFPRETFDTNVMGTVNLLEALRGQESVKSILNVTTDKVYLNREWCWGYRETDPLDGYDPYSNSKSCSELVTHSYSKSFFNERGIPVSTARAGNVIGGGDFSKDRIIPDCVRAALKKEKIVVRNPFSIRPYQHVLEPLVAYLLIVYKQYQDINLASSYNVGPQESDCVTTGRLVDLFCKYWEGAVWSTSAKADEFHEASFLKLDCSKIQQTLGWSPEWNIEKAIEQTVNWTKAWISHEDVTQEMDREIFEYLRNFDEE